MAEDVNADELNDKGDVTMETTEKYARLVFEEEIPEGATNEEIVRKMKERIQNYIENCTISIDDMEITDRPYMKGGDVYI